MEIVAILGLIKSLVPLAQGLVDALHSANAIDNKPAEVLAIIDKLTPVAGQLVDTIEKIRTQTEADHAAVWSPIRDDWTNTVAKWNEIAP